MAAGRHCAVSERASRPASAAQMDKHRMIQKLIFTSGTAGGPHRYSTLMLNKDAWTECVGMRMPTSYQRIMALQPLPSTACDLAARATSLYGPSLEAALRHAQVLNQINDWKAFATDRRTVTSRKPSASDVRSEAQKQRPASGGIQRHDIQGAPMQCRVDGSLVHLKKQHSYSARSMFHQLKLSQEPAARNGSQTERITDQRDSSDSCIMPAHTRKFKTKTQIVKKQEMVEAKSKRKSIWYNLPGGELLVASDQSALAARNSIVLTALAEADELERERVRHHLWQLMRIEGAVAEDKKMLARDALSSGDMGIAMKIITEAELQIVRMNAHSKQHFTAFSRVAETPKPASASKKGALGTPTCTDIYLPPPLKRMKRISQKRDGQAVGFAEEGDRDPQTTSRESSPVTSHASPQQIQRPTSTHELEQEQDNLENTSVESFEEGVSKASETEEPGERRFKLKVRSEKQIRLDEWLSLAEKDDCISGTERAVETQGSIELPSHRLTEMPQFILSSNDEKVRLVNLCKNSIPSIPERFCSTLQHMQECNLGYNLLSALPHTIGNLNNLQKLFVNANRLRGLPFSIGALTKLQVLNIEKNFITRLPCSLSSVCRLRILLTRGNPPFSQPPQALLDVHPLPLDDIRANLKAVLEAGRLSRLQVWAELEKRKSTIPALLMSLAGSQISADWHVKQDGRPADITVTKDHLYQKLRWELKLIPSKQCFRDLWEFLDEDNNGHLTYRQFLYQMKKPFSVPSLFDLTVEHVDVHEVAHRNELVGKLEISISGNHMPKAELFKEMDTYCIISQDENHHKTNVVKESSEPQWTFQGRLPAVSIPALELSLFAGELALMRPILVRVFEFKDSAEMEIGRVEVGSEDLREIVSAGNGRQVEHTYELLSGLEKTSTGTAQKQGGMPLAGFDGKYTSVTLKFRPFLFETNNGAGDQIRSRYRENPVDVSVYKSRVSRKFSQISCLFRS